MQLHDGETVYAVHFKHVDGTRKVTSREATCPHP